MFSLEPLPALAIVFGISATLVWMAGTRLDDFSPMTTFALLEVGWPESNLIDQEQC
jgi:hypothetical protein